MKLYRVVEKNNIQVNIIKFYYENIDEIGDYDGNLFIFLFEKVSSDRFMLLNEVLDSGFGIYGRKDIFNESFDIINIFYNNIWLCNLMLYRSKFVKYLEECVKK